jgi:5-methylcytosine-specific restriction endonuclease McrA
MLTIKGRVSSISTKVGSPAIKRIVGRRHGRIRDRILLRDEYRCCICGRLGKPMDLEVDHIVPLHLGGAESDSNRSTICRKCHALKSAVEGKERDNKY